MTEKTNGVYELKKEEMARVSGGGFPYDPPKPVVHEDIGLVEQPHCPGCGLKVDSFSGLYKCLSNGCEYKGCIIDPKDLIWK